MSDQMRAEDIQDLPDLLTWMRRYADGIFIRSNHEGRWKNYSLSQLPDRLRSEHEARFIEEGRVPCRVLSKEEMGGDSQAPDKG